MTRQDTPIPIPLTWTEQDVVHCLDLKPGDVDTLISVTVDSLSANAL